MTEKQSRVETYGHWTSPIVLGIIVVGGLIPLILYWFFFGQAPTVTPTQAKTLLRAADSSAVLVDVRKPAEFSSRHIDGAKNWPAAEVFALASQENIPEQFRNRTLLLVCDAGVVSRSATKHLIGIGLEEVKNVRGGMQEWIGSVAGPKADVFDRWITQTGEIAEFPFHPMPWHLQLLAVIIGFVVKPTYMLLSLAVVIVLRQSKSADLVALRWSMIFFFAGESSCAVYYIFSQACYLLEYLHSFGMLLSFGFAAYALFEGMDTRILRLSDPDQRCAAMSLCTKCIKYEDAPCRLRQTFLVIIPALAVVALMPLSADWQCTSYNTMIFGTFYNYSHRVLYQGFERLYCPIASAVLLMVSLLILQFKKKDPLPLAKLFFAAGIGPMGFGIIRTILGGMYSQNKMWFDFWEEITELLFISGVCFVLWIFRRGLFKRPARELAKADEG